MLQVSFYGIADMADALVGTISWDGEQYWIEPDAEMFRLIIAETGIATEEGYVTATNPELWLKSLYMQFGSPYLRADKAKEVNEDADMDKEHVERSAMPISSVRREQKKLTDQFSDILTQISTALLELAKREQVTPIVNLPAPIVNLPAPIVNVTVEPPKIEMPKIEIPAAQVNLPQPLPNNDEFDLIPIRDENGNIVKIQRVKRETK